MARFAKESTVLEAGDYFLPLAVFVMMAQADLKNDPESRHRRSVRDNDMRRTGLIPMTREAVLAQGGSCHSGKRYRRRRDEAKMVKRLGISVFRRRDLHSRP